MKETNNDEEKGSEMYGNAAHNIYAQNNIGIESPAKLIEMLYEGVLRFNAQSKRFMKDGNLEKKIYWINRSVAVIIELSSILEYKKGEDVSHYLSGLYDYQLQLLMQANMEDSVEKLDECSNVFKGLLDAWRETTNVA